MRILLLLVCLLVFTSFPKEVSAHLVGQPPYFKINGQYSDLYPVPLTSLPDFNLPQDLAPENYLKGQELNFEFDLEKLPAPPEVVKKTKFTWDFGDGSRGTGLSNTHSYTKIGSYILVILADDGTTPEPQLIQSVLVNVLPDKSYKLPKSKISVNGQSSKDPITDILKMKFGEELTFDGSKSEEGTAKIVSYEWDFGDQQGSKGELAKHFYKSDLSQVFPVLRVKDENGFISDNYLELQNQALDNSNPFTKPQVVSRSGDKKQDNQLWIGLGAVGIVILTAFFVRNKLIKKKFRNGE